MQRSTAVLRLGAGGVIISFAPVLVNVADVGPTIIGFYRMAIGGIVLAIIAAVRRTGWPLPRGYVMLAAAAGGFLAIDLAVWHRSIHLIGPGLATIFGNLQVFVYAAFGILVLREAMNARLLIAIPVAVVGLALIFGAGDVLTSRASQLGYLLGALTAITYAGYLIVLRHAQVLFARDPSLTMATVSLTAAVLLGASGLMEGASFAVPNRHTLAALIGLGLLPQVIGWILIAGALPYVDTARTGLLLLLQPALAFVWDLVLFARPIVVLEVLGATLTLAAIYMGMRATSGTPSGGATPAGAT